MSLNELGLRIKDFEKNANFDKTSAKELLEMMEEEIKNLKANPKAEVRNNKIIDIIILALQIANRYNINLNEELTKWFNKSKKYLIKGK